MHTSYISGFPLSSGFTKPETDLRLYVGICFTSEHINLPCSEKDHINCPSIFHDQAAEMSQGLFSYVTLCMVTFFMPRQYCGEHKITDLLNFINSSMTVPSRKTIFSLWSCSTHLLRFYLVLTCHRSAMISVVLKSFKICSLHRVRC